MKKVAEYTTEELERIGRKFLLDYRLRNRVAIIAARELKQRHHDEYKAIYRETREKLLPIVDNELTQFSRDYRVLGMKAVARRIHYAQRRKEIRARHKEELQGKGPVSFQMAGYWTKCSCGHIAQEHDAQGICPTNTGTRYDGKWVLIEGR